MGCRLPDLPARNGGRTIAHTDLLVSLALACRTDEC